MCLCSSKCVFFFFFPVVDWYMVLSLKSKESFYVFCVCIYEFLLLLEYLFDLQSCLWKHCNQVCCACVFISYSNPASKFALVDLNWLNFPVTYLFSMVMFWSLLQVLIPSSFLTVRFLESVELLISRLGSVARVIIFLQMLEFGKEPKGRWEKEENRRKNRCRHYQFHSSTWSHLLLPPQGSQYHLLCFTAGFSLLPAHSRFYTFCLSVSQEAARAGCVYCWGNWSSLERAWPWPC